MSSSIFFKFRSQKEPLQITFDGTSLSVFEVKRDIIALSKLGDGTDFDLDIYTADGKEIYDDDTTQIPRSTTVIARRHPSKPGAGRAARYVSGKMPVNAKNAHRVESTAVTASSKNIPNMDGAINSGKELTEEEKLQALLSANDQTWRAEQESMSHKPVVRSNYNKSAAVPDKPLPPGYICHRCGEKGHWIQACPTNNDPNFDGRPKFKRTTGIPRSFLKVVDKPTDVGEDGKTDISQRPKGVMYTANGEWVIAEPDNATWEKIQEKQNAAAEKAKDLESDELELRERGLECTLHNGIFVDPVKTPCCEKTYCNSCLESALLDNDLKCPNCGYQPVLLDSLQPDDEMAAKVKAYEDEKKTERQQKQKEASQSPAAGGSPTGDTAERDSKTDTTAPEIKVNGAASPPNEKKRAAEDDLPNDRKPSNPAIDMKKTASNQGTPTPAPSSSNTPKPPQPPLAPAADMAEFQKQMQAMAASMGGMGGMQNGMPAMMNPMMPAGFNPAMMGMNMNMPGFSPAMMGMPGMNMNMPMPNFGGMNGNMNGWGGNGNGTGQMGNGGGNGNWQGGSGGGGRGGGMQGGGSGNDGPYMRQPVNPNRHRGRYGRPRSTDYRQI